jgi:hypothetical protein
VLLYIGKRINQGLLKDLGKEIEGERYFSPTSIGKVAKYPRFKPEKIAYERTRAVNRYLKY